MHVGLDDWVLVMALAALLLTGAAVWLLGRSFVVAPPDEWLLVIRNSKLVKAGVGISAWRRPGDAVARFTSTMQRVSFTVEALSNERLRVSIEGFLLWSVAPEGDGPFRAFRKLGLVDAAHPPADAKSKKHLLSTPQHRAFRELMCATVQRVAATRPLDHLLLDQQALVAQLRAQLVPLERDMGIRVDQVELLRVRPAEAALLEHMSAEVEERVRERAAGVRLEAAERGKRRQIESDARVAEGRAEARRQDLAREQEVRLAEIEHEREAEMLRLDRARQQVLASEATAAELARAASQREDMLFEARLDRIRREAEASRDAAMALASAEESKSQAVRNHELARLVAEKVGDALARLPLGKPAGSPWVGTRRPARSPA